MRKGWFALLALSFVALGTSCKSISDSVTSPSRWVGDSSESSGKSSDSSSDSSRSSSPSEEKEVAAERSFRDDVRVATVRFAASGRDASDWQRQLGHIAEQHGVSHWEGRPGSWIAIGSGLGEAGLSESELDDVLAKVGAVDAEQRTLVREGYAYSAAR